MSRAFVIERDEWFTCFIMNRNCKHANLRGDCTLNKCVYEDDADSRTGDGSLSYGKEAGDSSK